MVFLNLKISYCVISVSNLIVCHGALGHQTEANSSMKQVPGLIRRKNNQIEAFVLKRVNMQYIYMYQMFLCTSEIIRQKYIKSVMALMFGICRHQGSKRKFQLKTIVLCYCWRFFTYGTPCPAVHTLAFRPCYKVEMYFWNINSLLHAFSREGAIQTLPTTQIPILQLSHILFSARKLRKSFTTIIILFKRAMMSSFFEFVFMSTWFEHL